MNSRIAVAVVLLGAALALEAALPRAVLAAARTPTAGAGSGQYGGGQNDNNGNQGVQVSNNGASNNGAQNAGYQNNPNPNNGQNQNGSNQSGGNQSQGAPSGDQYVPGPDVTYTSMTILERGRADVAASTSAAAASASPPARPAPEPELSLGDAREDFSTIVQSYLLKNGGDGAWTYQDARGRKRALALVKVETGTVARASRRRYAGLVRLRGVADGKETKLVFTVDLSGDDWKVVSVAEPRAAKKAGAP